MKNANEVATRLFMNNPQFKSFYEQNKNKSVDEICRDYGVDQNALREIIG